MGQNPDLLKSALKSTGIICYFLSPCWQSQVSMFLSLKLSGRTSDISLNMEMCLHPIFIAFCPMEDNYL